LAGPSRLGAIVIVTLLSCVVLGAVWGVVIYLLPHSDNLPESSPVASIPQPQSSPSLSLPAPSSPEHPAPPVTVKEEAAVPAGPMSLGRRASEAFPVPQGLDVKCDMDIDALCPEEEGDRRSCLQRKVPQLSAPCQPLLRERLVRMKETMQHLRAACESDRRQFCRDAPLGGGAIVQCLEAHAQEVSDQCFRFLPKRGRLLN
jgi:hypothetical protein